MYVGAGLVSLLATFVVASLGLFGFRLAAARWAGVRGWAPIFAFDQKPWATVSFGRRLLFTLAGPIGVYLVAALGFAAGYGVGGETTIDETSMRVDVRADSAAQAAGIQRGDQVLSVDGVAIHDWDQLKAEVGKHPSERIDVVVRREASNLTIPATPSPEGKLGISPYLELHSLGPGGALAKGLSGPAIVVGNAAKAFLRVFVGSESVALSGPVGIARETGRAQKTAMGQYLLLLSGLMSYFLLVPSLLLSLVFFPRAPRKP